MHDCEAYCTPVGRPEALGPIGNRNAALVSVFGHRLLPSDVQLCYRSRRPVAAVPSSRCGCRCMPEAAGGRCGSEMHTRITRASSWAEIAFLSPRSNLLLQGSIDFERAPFSVLRGAWCEVRVHSSIPRCIFTRIWGSSYVRLPSYFPASWGHRRWPRLLDVPAADIDATNSRALRWTGDGPRTVSSTHPRVLNSPRSRVPA